MKNCNALTCRLPSKSASLSPYNKNTSTKKKSPKVGTQLGAGRQGVVYDDPNDNKKVIKKRTYYPERRKIKFQYRAPPPQSLIKEVKLLARNKATLDLINQHPHMFEEVALQHHLSQSGLAPGVHLINAMKRSGGINVYFYMNKARKTTATPSRVKKLQNNVKKAGVVYHDGDKVNIKPDHVFDLGGKLVVINLGDSTYGRD
jgi:hypothetical protein